MSAPSKPLLRRMSEVERPTVAFSVDGQQLSGLAGDTVLTAVLSNGRQLRVTEFLNTPRAGFCLMGACQDCWVVTSSGLRLRACSTPLEEGMELRTRNFDESEVVP